jgi:hypothetical protein
MDGYWSVIIMMMMMMMMMIIIIIIMVSRDSAVGIATSYWLNDRGVGVRVPVRSRIFTSPFVLTGSGVHTTYPMGTGGSFPEVKVAGARS